MEFGAYSRIDAWRLPRPAVIEVSDLALLPGDTTVYVRGPKGIPLLNRRCHVADLLEFEVIGQLAEVKGITIEISPESVFGGAALLFGTEVYVETVYGHVSSLLHSGQCALRSHRVLVSNDTRHRETRQEYMVSQNASGSVTSYSVPVAEGLLFRVADAVLEVLSDLRGRELRLDPILFEWMWSSSGALAFIDCKDQASAGWHFSLETAVSDRAAVIESTVSASLVEVCVIRDFCSYFKENWPPYHARVRSEALLSHFFTYTASVPRIIEMV